MMRRERRLRDLYLRLSMSGAVRPTALRWNIVRRTALYCFYHSETRSRRHTVLQPETQYYIIAAL